MDLLPLVPLETEESWMAAIDPTNGRRNPKVGRGSGAPAGRWQTKPRRRRGTRAVPIPIQGAPRPRLPRLFVYF